MNINNYFINPAEDYRIPLHGFAVNSRGDLYTIEGSRRRLLISHNHLTDDDMVSDLLSDYPRQIGAFLSAYFCACEVAGIKRLNIRLYGWCSTFKLDDCRK